MKLEIDKHGLLILQDVYEPMILETACGKRLSICMRDDTFEIALSQQDDPDSVVYRVEGVEMVKMSPPTVKHGWSCPKAIHDGTGYLHDEDDDEPYPDLDVVVHCGRCHQAV